MDLPKELRDEIDIQLNNINIAAVAKDAANISSRYREESGDGRHILTSDNEALAYAITRMPATYSSVYTALNYLFENIKDKPKTLLDVGAGTGAASWAADSLLELEKITCIEREKAMHKLGKSIMKKGSQALQNSVWISKDIELEEINEKADLVIASYVINEIREENRVKVAQKLWNLSNDLLLIIEPGTVVGSKNIQSIRTALVELGAHIIAPCTHEISCNNEWCHFSSRLSRSSFHRNIKSGEAPYEDEKFMYIALSRNSIEKANMRILRHPQIRKGHILLDICTNEGSKSIMISKKEGDIYKKARKIGWGDHI